MTKKVVAMLLSLVMAAGCLTACGDTKEPADTEKESSVEADASSETPDDTDVDTPPRRRWRV